MITVAGRNRCLRLNDHTGYTFSGYFFDGLAQNDLRTSDLQFIPGTKFATYATAFEKNYSKLIFGHHYLSPVLDDEIYETAEGWPPHLIIGHFGKVNGSEIWTPGGVVPSNLSQGERPAFVKPSNNVPGYSNFPTETSYTVFTDINGQVIWTFGGDSNDAEGSSVGSTIAKSAVKKLLKNVARDFLSLARAVITTP
jgi:hypothetical protein